MLIQETLSVENISSREGVPASIRVNKHPLMEDCLPTEKKSKIYVLKDPLTLRVRYVGNTYRSLYDRLIRHFQDARKGRYNPDKNEWILDLENRGLKPIIETIDETDISNALACEVYWIRHYKAQNSDLFNILSAGEPQTPKNKILLHKNTEGRRMRFTGNTLCKGRIPSPEELAKRSATHKETYRLGLRRRQTQPKPNNRHPVCQYDLQGNFIAGFIGVTWAAEETGVGRRSISENIRGASMTAGGYIFKYKDESKTYPRKVTICQAE